MTIRGAVASIIRAMFASSYGQLYALPSSHRQRPFYPAALPAASLFTMPDDLPAYAPASCPEYADMPCLPMRRRRHLLLVVRRSTDFIFTAAEPKRAFSIRRLAILRFYHDAIGIVTSTHDTSIVLSTYIFRARYWHIGKFISTRKGDDIPLLISH